ncbi:O-methyltransferase [Paenibacillus sp. CN-4]|uniref:O-methyltransferase n=1 Tax=Paenibacillus nanchangensis TaxID=3348343 RepID=UPI00397B1D2E
MTQNKRWAEVDDYLTERLIPQDSIMDEVLAANKEAGLPEIDVTPGQGQLLQIFARMQGAKRILEIGTLGGYSTIWLARALPEGGQLVTLEIDPGAAQTARSNFKRAGVEKKITLRNGEALMELARMEEEGTEPFDLIFIDADKPNNPGYLKWALRFAHPGTVIIGDNVIRDGEIVAENSGDPRVQGVRTFFDLISAEPRLTATAIQTVGGKGYDGFLIGIVEE